MPLTVPAHQSFVIPLKIWRPHLFDGTALFVAAAAPDLAYPVMARSHSVGGLLLWVVPFTLVVCALMRWRSAAAVFAQLPDLGRFRVRSYGVLSSRTPGVLVTVSSTLIGGVSHILVDAFTHTGRWGTAWTGSSEALVEIPLVGVRSVTWLLQYAGHGLGSLAGILLLLYIGDRRLLEQWYSESEVERARDMSVRPIQRLLFWSMVGLVAGTTTLLGLASDRDWVFSLLLGAAIGLVGAGMFRLPGDPRPA